MNCTVEGFQPVDKLGGGVPDPISYQKMRFSTPVFRRGFQNPYPFSDLAPKKLCHP